MDTAKEFWNRLEGEPTRAFEAFRTFLSLPGGDRTMVTAYRQFVGNPDASKPSDAWNEWARRYTWKERARAYDAHIDRIRQNAVEKAVKEEAAEQAQQAERARNNLDELMDVGFLRASEYLEELDPASMRFSDVARIIGLHLDAIVKLDSSDESGREADWTIENEAALADIFEEIDKQGYPDEFSDEGDPGDDQLAGAARQGRKRVHRMMSARGSWLRLRGIRRR